METMIDDFIAEYDDFEVIILDPNKDYVDSDDTDDEMDYETIAECTETQKDSTETTIEFCQQKSNEIFDNEINLVVHSDDREVDDTSIKDHIIEEINNNSNSELNKPRKKLNLEEYKIRRANKPAPAQLENRNVLELCENIPDTLPPIILPTDPRSIKNLLASQQENLLEFAVEQTELPQDLCQAIQNTDLDYEEIVLVSIGCNTDISISPKHEDGGDESSDKKASSNLFTNIVNNNKIIDPSTSLLSSINAVLSEKRTNAAEDEVKLKGQQKSADDHGENKIIMHLRKDRVRPFRSSCDVQTDVTPLFPPLILSPSLIFNRIKNARNYRRASTRSRSRSRSISPEPEYYHRRSNFKYSRSVNSSSMNSSDSSSESDTSAYSSCRSTDSSKQRFGNRLNNNKNGYQRPNFNYQEERKIIYIGGLFEETTKDELRRKFLKYGTIRKISMHTKEDGSLRFGFVTFAEQASAYDVLDRFLTDPALCNFDLRFGGRRKFCRQNYADLDSCNQENEDIYNNNNNPTGNKKSSQNAKSKTELSFEDLLNLTKKELCKNK